MHGSLLKGRKLRGNSEAVAEVGAELPSRKDTDESVCCSAFVAICSEGAVGKRAHNGFGSDGYRRFHRALTTGSTFCIAPPLGCYNP